MRLTTPREITKGILETIEGQRAQVRKFLTELTDDEINWNPQVNRNSIGNLLEHMTAAEALLLQSVIMGSKVDRNRDKEFEYRYRSKKELENAYNYVANASRSILENKLNDKLLNQTRTLHNKHRTVLWILLHLIEHSNYHIGQAQYIIGLLKGEKFLPIPGKRPPIT